MNKARFKKLKKGTQVYFTKKAIKWHDENAFIVCEVGGAVHKDHEVPFFWRKAIGQGLPYKAAYLSSSPYEEEGYDECKIKVTVGKIIDIVYVDRKDLK